MQSRREFIRNVAGAAGLLAGSPAAILKALAIEPEPGSTFLDAEHVVILMQENRSFDHAFGTLRGVRGFNDPRAITLPDGNPVWVQTTAQGDRYAPFRLDIKDSKSTWMGCLPHNWTDQVDARNQGRYDRWLTVKQSGRRAYAAMPLTLGYYTRADIPFYYALADAFTICDQHFCSSLTGTTPNRLHLWTGTIRARQSPDAKANVLNSDVDHGRWAGWTTFPERLEDLGISWKIYQNELAIESGLTTEEDSWLANFGDNPMEYFLQFHVRHAAPRRQYVSQRIGEIPGEIEALRKQLKGLSRDKTARIEKRIADLIAKLKEYEAERAPFSEAAFSQLSARAQRLHEQAFVTNRGDPAYRRLTPITYRDNGVERRLNVPKGDVLHQFRQDVTNGRLPAVSWLVGSEKLSDHPASAWYGAWYISEVLNILTSNPDIWKKTIFILTYDENDGYFDHVPPFVAPHPRKPETGSVTSGLDVALEYVELEQDAKTKSRSEARDSPIGLGYRVPMIIASPWSRGGCVCSQVFDHTSSIQFLEKLLSHKTGKSLVEPNINAWRRAVCGDLTSAFQAPGAGAHDALEYLKRDPFMERIHQAQFKPEPAGFRKLSDADLDDIRKHPQSSRHRPRQEPGVRRSAPLPYQLDVDGQLDRARFVITMAAGRNRFGPRSAGAPFVIYAFTNDGSFAVRNYALEAGTTLQDSWALSDFVDGRYHFRVDGPNGFHREFRGGAGDPPLAIRVPTGPPTGSGDVLIAVESQPGTPAVTIHVRDHAYQQAEQTSRLEPGRPTTIRLDTRSSLGWYDFSVRVAGSPHFEQRFAGRIETGEWRFSDPAMGR